MDNIKYFTSHNTSPIVTKDPAMLKILSFVTRVANTEANVVIFGESGTGKELIANALHFQNNKRKIKPFIPVNCGAFNENLLGSELFGHVRGAFTGATMDKSGWFEHADGGTIFLDEVNEMSLTLQVIFLRILQTGEYNRLGSTEINRCNVRILAATNKNLEELVKEGKFREDLYYRLNVLRINLPPLRERECDIICLARYFLRIFSAKYEKENTSLSSDVEQALLSYDFPGNIRELENIIQQTVIMADGKLIELFHLPNKFQRNCKVDGNISMSLADAAKEGYSKDFKSAKRDIIEKFENTYINDCLRYTKGNITRAAYNAGIDVKNFSNKMRKYHIQAYCYK